MQMPTDPSQAQSAPHGASSVAPKGEGIEPLRADDGVLPFNDDIYEPLIFEPNTHHDEDFDSLFRGIDSQLHAGNGLERPAPEANGEVFHKEAAVAGPAETFDIDARHEIQAPSQAELPQTFSSIDPLAVSPRRQNPAHPPPNAHQDAILRPAQLHEVADQEATLSSSGRTGHVRPQQGAANHGQGWRGNPPAFVHPRAQTSGTQILMNAHESFRPSSTLPSFRAANKAPQQPVAGYTHAHFQAQHPHHRQRPQRQQQARYPSTPNGFYGMAASAAQANMAATPVYQSQPLLGHQLHPTQAYSASALGLHYPASSLCNANISSDYFTPSPVSVMDFGATFPYGQHSAAGTRSYPSVPYGAPALASSEDQTSEYALPSSNYPPPEIAAQQIPPYGNVRASPTLHGRGSKRALATDSSKGNARKGPLGGGQGYPGENWGGLAAGSEDFSDLYRLPGTVPMGPPARVKAPQVETTALWRQPPPQGYLEPPRPWTPPAGSPRMAEWVKNGRVSSNREKMKQGDKECNPSYFYHSLKLPPPDFGPTLAGGCHRYAYTLGVQLAEGRSFSKNELAEFIRGRPDGVPCTLRVQATPSQISKRLEKDDSRCRWANCPIPNRTIGAGWYRVAFDEFPQWTSDGTLDPYKMAGMLHLWCFEQCFDITKFPKDRLQAEERSLPKEEKNSAALTRDTDREIIREAYDKWFKKHRGTRADNGPWVPREHKESLSYELTRHHLENQTQARATSRQLRNQAKNKGKSNGGTSKDQTTIDCHLGDLAMYAEGMQQKKLKNRESKRQEAKSRADRKDVELEEEIPETKIGGDDRAADKSSSCQGAPPAGHAATGKVGKESEYDLVELGAVDGGAQLAMEYPDGFNPLAHFVEGQVPSLVQAGSYGTAGCPGRKGCGKKSTVKAPRSEQAPKRKRDEPQDELAEESSERGAKRTRPEQAPMKRKRDEPQEEGAEKAPGRESKRARTEHQQQHTQNYGEDQQETLERDDLFGDGFADEVPLATGDHVLSEMDGDFWGGECIGSGAYEPEHDFANFWDDDGFKARP